MLAPVTALGTVRGVAIPLPVIELLPPSLVQAATMRRRLLSAFLDDFLGAGRFQFWSKLDNNLRFVNFMAVEFGDGFVSEFGVFVTDDRLVLN